LMARAQAYEGWSKMLLGEAFCTTVFSTLQGTDFVFGSEITRAEAFAQADADLTTAIASITPLTDTASVSLLRMAYLGRARVRLDIGNLAGARADAALVPAAFVYNVTASAVSTRRNNRVFNESNTLGTASSVGLFYRTLNDPRVPVQNRNQTNALGVQSWAQLKYATSATSIPAATGIEAQLIIAEADAATPATAVNAIAIINASRAAGNQTPYAGATDPASLKNEIVDQRRRALFLTGTHLGDVVRYNITLANAIGANYPAGGTYGDQRCAPAGLRGYPLPDAERQNNPVLNP
jgi:starch-binding outer membrane protein, SusD/RagB family